MVPVYGRARQTMTAIRMTPPTSKRWAIRMLFNETENHRSRRPENPSRGGRRPPLLSHRRQLPGPPRPIPRMPFRSCCSHSPGKPIREAFTTRVFALMPQRPHPWAGSSACPAASRSSWKRWLPRRMGCRRVAGTKDLCGYTSTGGRNQPAGRCGLNCPGGDPRCMLLRRGRRDLFNARYRLATARTSVSSPFAGGTEAGAARYPAASRSPLSPSASG